MYNTVIMLGNLTRDIELRYAPNGTAVAKSAIATSHKYKSQSGETKEEVCFLDFTIFGRVAEVANQYLKKGSRVLLEGRLVFEQWKAQDGSNRSKHSLLVENLKMLDAPKASTEEGHQTQQVQHQDQPQAQVQQIQQNFSETIEDDEIPF